MYFVIIFLCNVNFKCIQELYFKTKWEGTRVKYKIFILKTV